MPVRKLAKGVLSMLLNHINHRMPVYKDCTLHEVITVGAIIFLGGMIALSALTKIIFGYGSIGMIITFLAFVPATKLALARLEQMKYGKPYGYYQQKLRFKLMCMGLLPHKFIIRQGKWTVRRRG
jgi:conjugative transfer region protein (TIGR03750 family)